MTAGEFQTFQLWLTMLNMANNAVHLNNLTSGENVYETPGDSVMESKVIEPRKGPLERNVAMLYSSESSYYRRLMTQ